MINVNSFTSGFVNPTLLEALTNSEGKTPVITEGFRAAQNEAKNFVGSLPLGFRGMFDIDTYTIKRAQIHIYNYVLQNKAELSALGIEGLNLNDDQVFQHYYDLREHEEKYIESMRQEALDYMTASSLRSTSNGGYSSQGVAINFRARKNRYTGRYY